MGKRTIKDKGYLDVFSPSRLHVFFFPSKRALANLMNKRNMGPVDQPNGLTNERIKPMAKLIVSVINPKNLLGKLFQEWLFSFSFHRGDVFRPSTPGSYVPPLRSHSGPPQNYARQGYPPQQRSNPSTPLSSRDYNDPRGISYNRNHGQRYNSGGYQGNQPTPWSHTMPSYRGPGSSQFRFSQNNYSNSSRDPRQQQNNWQHGRVGLVPFFLPL